MDLTGKRTVYPCQEYGTARVPFSVLMKDGELEVYPQVAKYFDVNYQQGVLALRATRYVGYIPISDHVAINVEPRASIGNLLWMVWRSGVPLANIRGFIRRYQERPDTIDKPEELYAGAFVEALKEASVAGTLRRYERRVSDVVRRGRLLLGPTISRFRSRGNKFRHVFELSDFTTDIPENRLIKSVAEQLVAHLFAAGSNDDLEAAQQLTLLLEPFSLVNRLGGDPNRMAASVERLVRGLPRTHAFYEPILWLCFLILTRSGLAMESVGRVLFDSIIIDVAKVFEHYVRKVCVENEKTYFGNGRILSGADRPIVLFPTTGKFHTEPDIYVSVGGKPVAVADVKYKPEPKREDRYELLAFCEAAQVKRSAFICPLVGDTPPFASYGKTAGGISVDVVRFNLAAQDMEREETVFLGNLRASLLGV